MKRHVCFAILFLIGATLVAAKPKVTSSSSYFSKTEKPSAANGYTSSSFSSSSYSVSSYASRDDEVDMANKRPKHAKRISKKILSQILF